MRKTTYLLAVCACLAALSPAWSDEGLWLFSHPPRQQLKKNYAFDLTDSLLERLQKASVMVGHGGSGSFVSSDGLVLTNHHVGLHWLQELSETGPDLVRNGFCADNRAKELRCAGLELRVLWSMQDVSARVQDAIKPNMTLAQASKAREAVMRGIEEESRLKTGLQSKVVALHHGGRHELYRYKKYTDVRLVFAPEEDAATLLDVCFFRAYEKGKPARTPHHIAWSPAAPQSDDLVLVSGHPGVTDRFRTTADLEDLYGPRNFLNFKELQRLDSVLDTFAKTSPANKRHARAEAQMVSNAVHGLFESLRTQERLLGQMRTRENARQASLDRDNPAAGKEYRQACERIAAAIKNGEALAQAHLFLETSYAFRTPLFRYARTLLRLADESAKPESERLAEYRQARCPDLERHLLEPRVIIKEMEIVKLADSLDLWTRYAGADEDLVAKILDGKTPEERARALIEGSQLDQIQVRKALIQGGAKAVAASHDPMLALARLVDARSRNVRREFSEKVAEPCQQAYAVLTRLQQQHLGGDRYPDATGTLRFSFGKVQDYADSQFTHGSHTGITSLAEIFAYFHELRQDAAIPKKWDAARSQLDYTLPILFTTSADGAPGNSGSPVVDRQGRLIGVLAWGHTAVPELAHVDKTSGCSGVVALGILEVLDKVYHAAGLVKELSSSGDSSTNVANNQKTPRKRPLPPPVLSAADPGFPPPLPARSGSNPSPSTSSSAGTAPEGLAQDNPPTGSLRALIMGSIPPFLPQAGIDPIFDGSRSATLMPPHMQLIPPPASVMEHGPATETPPSNAAKAAPGLVVSHKELVPALIKALNDPHAEVRKAAASALENLGGDALPALIEAFQAKDKLNPTARKTATGQIATKGRNGIPELVRALEHEDVEVRLQAARSLATRVRDRRATEKPPPVQN